MRIRRWAAAAAAATLGLLCASGLSGQDGEPVTREEFNKLKLELEKLRGSAASPAHAPGAAGASGPAAAEGAAGGASSPGKAGIFDKPFLRGVTPQAYLGGYFEIEFMDAANARHDFRFPRFVPFIYADIHERIRFASEVEIEDGTEIDVEFAFLDFILWKLANLRAGVILDPLGKFNLIHDSPINDLTDRPLVDQFVIPTTLREIGAGLFGTLTSDESSWEVKYEAYLVSGFKGLSDDPADDPTITRVAGLRGATAFRDSLGTRAYGDNNNSFSGVGRLSVSPFLGTEVGASAHHGAYDEDGDNNLTIAAIDGLYTLPQFRTGDVPIGPIEVLAEGAYAFIERNAFARSEGVPDDFWGYYAQLNYHFLPESFLPEGTCLTTALFPDSTFTLVFRWDHVDLDGDRRQRITLGLNFRPVETAVIKFDYQFNHGTGLSPATADDDAFIISIASYF